MTLDEWNNKFSDLMRDLESTAYGNIMAQCASKAVADIRDRVLHKGLDSGGGRYRDYSDAYKAMKQKEKKYKGFVDFSFTNRMWSNIKLTSPRDELNSGVAVIKGTTPEDQQKLNKNTAQRGDILVMNNEEKAAIVKIFDEGMNEILSRNGLK